MSTPSSSQFCANCGAALHPPMKFCPGCGNLQLSYTVANKTGVLAPDHLLKQRYRTKRLLGQGGMAAVFQAEDLHFNQAPRAIKEMSQSGLSTQELQEAIAALSKKRCCLPGSCIPISRVSTIISRKIRAGTW